jgi:single-strand DNA-binding protein
VTEIEADEICPSLRWATAQITKVNRRDGNGRGVDSGRSSNEVPAPTAPAADDVPF